MVTYVGINDIQERRDLMLLTDPFEVKWILYTLHRMANILTNFPVYFVSNQDSVYLEMFALEGSVP